MRTLFRVVVGTLSLVGAASIVLCWLALANGSWRTSEERSIAAIKALQRENDRLTEALRRSAEEHR